ncbi:hypothetical protein FHS19_001927 [Paenibacillus rhizosphaerae]|uniref:Uncharacterized protein n=1 Tax=Paenibacillus rhizosphaerae TaxID=297318 RepID=A0A839TL80_9BACL|nr:hypothetical protein [Paenibacillus rhizosphaerae]MBB3127273.1 hypothetical protein [Paenibacillus rhizosphaerae]
MSKWAKKVCVLGIWAGIGVLVGMQLASPDAPSPGPQAQTAAAAVQAGPQQGASPQQPSQPRQSSNRFKAADEQPQQEQVEVQDWHEKTPEQLLVDQSGTPTVDVLADKTAGLLQELSQKGIRLVVSLFSNVTE